MGQAAAWRALLLPILAGLFSIAKTAKIMQGHSTKSSLEMVHSAGMHIVIAMYQEDLDEVEQYIERLLSIPSISQTRPSIHLYVKGGPHFAAKARERRFVHNVIELPNVGREQETYIRHLVTHYDSLPHHVFFTQALPNSNGDFVISRLESQFNSKTGVLGLANVEVCTCEGHSDVFTEYGAGGFIRLREVFSPSTAHSGYMIFWHQHMYSRVNCTTLTLLKYHKVCIVQSSLSSI
jgi:hypothetical protein